MNLQPGDDEGTRFEIATVLKNKVWREQGKAFRTTAPRVAAEVSTPSSTVQLFLCGLCLRTRENFSDISLDWECLFGKVEEYVVGIGDYLSQHCDPHLSCFR